MISVTRLNGTHFYVNAELIKFVEATPDSVITLVDGSKLVVREAPAAIAQAVIDYRRQVAGERLALQGDKG
ncbi:MAG: flagellar FlbD family protein [Anaerolineales bacterium]|nr:flagellar FlbD family protein [Anaerolineales bacterium]